MLSPSGEGVRETAKPARDDEKYCSRKSCKNAITTIKFFKICKTAKPWITIG